MGDMTNSTPAQAPAAGAAPDDNSSQPLFVVCISAMPDGTYQVYEQDSDGDANDADSVGGNGTGSVADGSGQPGSMAAGGANMDNSGPQTAQSIDDALNIAGQMLQEEAGEDAGGDSGDQGDGNAPVKDPKAIWDQLAKKSDKARGVS